MNVSGLLVVVLVIVLLSLAIAYSVLTTTRPSVVSGLSPNRGSMSTATAVGSSGDGRDQFLVPAGATFMVYINTMMNSKTPFIGETQRPISLVSIGETVKLQLHPGGVSTPPKTVLAVRTQKPDVSTPSVEEFIVRDFPQQSWVHTVIVREGRRFTVYYNGQVVASHRTTYYPAIDSATITIGDSRLVGSFVYPKVAPTPYRLEEIKDVIQSSATTRFEPIQPVDWKQLTTMSLSFGCPNGLFCFSTQGAPSENPLKMWKTPYA